MGSTNIKKWPRHTPTTDEDKYGFLDFPEIKKGKKKKTSIC